VPNEVIEYYTKQLDGHLGEEAGSQIGFENASALFPRFRK
jgi:hypothetical protein